MIWGDETSSADAGTTGNKVLDDALKLLADIPGTDDIRIGAALARGDDLAKARLVLETAGVVERIAPGILQGTELELITAAADRAREVLRWPATLPYAVQVGRVLGRILTDKVTGPLRGETGEAVVGADGLVWLDEATVAYLKTLAPEDDWRIDDRAGLYLHVGGQRYPILDGADVP